ncbi:spalt-like transcription factor 4 [Leptotrombidium deliense]|uniref:Spalt-like transcription factor 4 n=1 Tax=Leptotrombidium deliense TaxID=299467 RepID=A0A443S9T3_9ACAR|nr:spalt-like transcription factor 4 [Leptotrombidium deliense]
MAAKKAWLKRLWQIKLAENAISEENYDNLMNIENLNSVRDFNVEPEKEIIDLCSESEGDDNVANNSVDIISGETNCVEQTPRRLRRSIRISNSSIIKKKANDESNILLKNNWQSYSRHVAFDQTPPATIAHVHSFILERGMAGLLVCEFCRFSTYKVKSIETHIRTVHLNERPYTCIPCRERFVTKAEIDAHLTTEKHELALKPQQFMSIPSFTAVPYDNNVILFWHNNNTNNADKNNVHLSQQSNTETPKTFVDSMPSNEALERETMTYSSWLKINDSDILEINSHNIVFDNSNITSVEQVNEYIRSVIKKKINMFQCKFCNYTLTAERSIQSHVRSVHLKEKPYLCIPCNQQFSTESLLVRHLRREKHYYFVNYKQKPPKPKAVKQVVSSYSHDQQNASCNVDESFTTERHKEPYYHNDLHNYLYEVHFGLKQS